MDLITRLRMSAFARPHLLVVAAPGAVELRLAVERYARERGWPAAESAADADVLAVVGTPDAGLDSVVSVLQSQIPAPWTRVDLLDPASVAAELAAAPARLAAWSPTPTVAAAHSAPGGTDHDHVHTEEGRHAFHPDSAAHDHLRHADGHHPDGHDERDGHGRHAAGAESAGHEHHGNEAGHDHDGMPSHGTGHEMGGHGMGGHEMGGHEHHLGAVAGLPMAGRTPDRDGLKLDVLHVPLGPVLPYWPAGLRLSLVVQGDVVQEVTVEPVGVKGTGASFWDEPVLRALAGDRTTFEEIARRRAASHLDSLMRFLGVAGFDGPALRCAVLRDRALDGERTSPLVAAFRPLGRRVVRSRVLRRMTEGLGELDGRTCDRLGISGPAAIAAGDVWARLQEWVRLTGEDLARLDDRSPVADVEGPRGRLDRASSPSAALLGVLPELLVGAELAGVRLIVASLDPDVAELSAQSAVSTRG